MMQLLVLQLALALAFHDVHVATARMTIVDNAVVMRVKLFRMDLQQALRADSRQADYTLEATPRGDAIFLAYARRHLTMTVAGRSLPLRIIGSGEEPAAKRELDVWYYDLRFDSPARIQAIEIRNALLFERFHDQRNTVTVLLPSGRQQTIFFVPDQATYQLSW